jgi:plasmid stabilization system protein ParE
VPPAPEVEVTARALADIGRLVRFLALKNPVAAKRLRETLWESFEAISLEPALGRRRRDLRERIVRLGRSAYVVRYAITPDAVIVLRIHHARESR